MLLTVLVFQYCEIKLVIIDTNKAKIERRTVVTKVTIGANTADSERILVTMVTIGANRVIELIE